MGKKRPTNHDSFSREDLVFRVAEMFFQGTKIRDIADQLSQQFVVPLTRESVYPLLAKARDLGLVRLVPPLEDRMAREIARRFGCDETCVTVVRTNAPHLNEYVAARAADIVLDLLRKVYRATKKPVGLGLGPGRATLDFSKHLGHRLRTEIDVPELKLFGICAGCPAKSPEYSSASFFNLFPQNVIVERIGLFAETIVTATEFERIKVRPGVREAFAQRDEISVLVTSMGDFTDPHDLLTMFLKEMDLPPDELLRRGWVGSVQYRPYSRSGPIHDAPQDLRAVTLFELDDFVRKASSKNQHVVLIARQCGVCSRTRIAALRPLLEVPELRVWSELVLDDATARELLSS